MEGDPRVGAAGRGHSNRGSAMENHAIIAGFGVAGRFVAEYLQARGIGYVVIDQNPHTCDTQRCLGVKIIQGDVCDEAVLRAAGIDTALVLALAIPDERAAVRATEIANHLRPEIHIIAATRYTSTGLKALKKGADEIIVAEQAVAREFYRRIDAFMRAREATAQK